MTNLLNVIGMISWGREAADLKGPTKLPILVAMGPLEGGSADPIGAPNSLISLGALWTSSE